MVAIRFGLGQLEPALSSSQWGGDPVLTHIPYLATRILINTNKSRLAEVVSHKGFRNHNLLINKSTPLYAAQKH
jgi:hypothetical protein